MVCPPVDAFGDRVGGAPHLVIQVTPTNRPRDRFGRLVAMNREAGEVGLMITPGLWLGAWS
jgi:hypothetical protein